MAQKSAVLQFWKAEFEIFSFAGFALHTQN